MKKKCRECGKEFEAKQPRFETCYDCYQKKKRQGGVGNTMDFSGIGGAGQPNPRHRPSGVDQGGIPAECVFTTFLDEEGYYKRAIFLESAQKAASLFSKPPEKSSGMTQSSLRQLFNMLKDAERRLRIGEDFGSARETFFRFARQVEYQTNREVTPRVFQDFVQKHIDTASKNPEEFKGFVEYLTSIMAQMKQK